MPITDAIEPIARHRDVPFVVDVFDRREDLSVQVKLTANGRWHRKMIGGHKTACGLLLGGYATRDDQYVGELCVDGCYSKAELAEIPSPANAPDKK